MSAGCIGASYGLALEGPNQSFGPVDETKTVDLNQLVRALAPDVNGGDGVIAAEAANRLSDFRPWAIERPSASASYALSDVREAKRSSISAWGVAVSTSRRRTRAAHAASTALRQNPGNTRPYFGRDRLGFGDGERITDIAIARRLRRDDLDL
jgi:hypothetical protein